MVKFSNPFKLFSSYCIKNKILSQFSKIRKPVIVPFLTFASTFAGRRLVNTFVFGLSGQYICIWPEWSIGYCGRKLDLDRSVNADQINQVNRPRLVKPKIAEAITIC